MKICRNLVVALLWRSNEAFRRQMSVRQSWLAWTAWFSPAPLFLTAPQHQRDSNHPLQGPPSPASLLSSKLHPNSSTASCLHDLPLPEWASARCKVGRATSAFVAGRREHFPIGPQLSMPSIDLSIALLTSLLQLLLAPRWPMVSPASRHARLLPTT
jgi:hypothetical protein